MIDSFLLFDSAKAKVADFDITVGVDEDIGRLKISVNEFAFVEVGDCMQDLICYVLALNGLQLTAAQSFGEVGLNVFEEGVDVLGELVVVIQCAIVSFFGVISNMMIFIDALDKVSPRSVGLPDLGGVFAMAGNDLIEFDYTGMCELEEVVELAVGTFGVSDILIGVANLFYREYLLGLFVLHFVHLTVGAFAQQAQNFIAFVDVVIDFRLVF